MRTVHLVYPHGQRLSCPDAIGRKVSERLQKHYDVKLYDWFQFGKITPGPNDVLVGHACPIPYTVFRASCKDKRWQRVILLSPHCHGDDYQPAFNDRIIRHCDLYLAITGRFWFDDLPKSGFKHWLPKMVHVDLAVDRVDFPPIKKDFAEAGKRKFVYIGSNAFYKNLGYLNEIASHLPPRTIDWIGSEESFGSLQALGRHDFGQAKSKCLISEYDYLITVGKADGNPTSVLEAMAWGLLPVCTKQSGYADYPGIRNIPLNDVQGALTVIKDLQDRSTESLYKVQADNWKLLDDHFTWERVSEQIRTAIEAQESPPIGSAPLLRRLALTWAEIRSPFWADLVSPKKVTRRLAKFQTAWSATGKPGFPG